MPHRAAAYSIWRPLLEAEGTASNDDYIFHDGIVLHTADVCDSLSNSRLCVVYCS